MGKVDGTDKETSIPGGMNRAGMMDPTSSAAASLPTGGNTNMDQGVASNSMMMMSNASIATIAAVAASAVQQMQQKGLAGGLGGLPQANSQAQQVAAFLAAAGQSDQQSIPGVAAARKLLENMISPVPTPANNNTGGLPPHVAAAILAGAVPPSSAASATSVASSSAQHAPFHLTSLLGGVKPPPPPHSSAAARLATNLAASEAASSLAGLSSQHRASASSSVVGGNGPAALSTMQNWTLEQLEQYVTYMRQTNQPVPQAITMLLAELRRKEEKRTAKRVANRKSACTSRARKKALVEEMTRTNAKLKRQALILSLLPDLVLAIDTKGVITYCSSQCERLLQYTPEDIAGARLEELLVPASRDVLRAMMKELIGAQSCTPAASSDAGTEQQRPGGDGSAEANPQNIQSGPKADEDENAVAANKPSPNLNSGKRKQASSQETGVAVVSEQSFPLSVVEVESKRSKRTPSIPVESADTNAKVVSKQDADNSDNSTGNGSGKQQTVSSLTNSNTTNTSRSPAADNVGGTSTGGGSGAASSLDDTKSSQKQQKTGSGDDSSSLSSDAKNMRVANDNLDRNVRWHNQRMHDSKKSKGKNKHRRHGDLKDDVTGDSITANNATAKLSSLQHVPSVEGPLEVSEAKDQGLKENSRYESNGDQSSSDDSLLAGVEEKKKGESASDDSGYRESSDSREETSSSGSDVSNSNAIQKKRFALSCKLCLVRNDMNTIWCEVTSSLRTLATEETEDETAGGSSSTPSPSKSFKRSSSGDEAMVVQPPAIAPTPPKRELLLCMRPIRDGEKIVDSSLRFVPPSRVAGSSELSTVPLSATSDALPNSGSSSSIMEDTIPNTKGPPKKRPASNSTGAGRPSKKSRGEEVPPRETEQSVVESLMLMNKSSQ